MPVKWRVKEKATKMTSIDVNILKQKSGKNQLWKGHKERPIEIDLHSHKGEIEGRPKNSSTIYTKTHKGITQSAATDKERSVWDRSNKHFEVFENILSLTSHWKRLKTIRWRRQKWALDMDLSWYICHMDWREKEKTIDRQKMSYVNDSKKERIFHNRLNPRIYDSERKKNSSNCK